MWRPLSAVALLAALAIAAGGAVAAGVPAGARRTVDWPAAVDVTYGSDALRDEIGLRVYLPPSYATSALRYPVVYFLHGLPASAAAYKGTDFLRRAMATLGREAIVVSVQGARDGEPDTEYLDSGPGHNWETAVAVEVPRIVDKGFRTIASRRGRAIVGLSAGGYGAMLLGVDHVAAYAVIESWSGYFHPTDASGTVGLDLGSDARNAQASIHRSIGRLARSLAKSSVFIAFYVGAGDRRFRVENALLDRELTAAGIAHLFTVYPGAHDQSLWSAHAATWLGFALDHLARPL